MSNWCYWKKMSSILYDKVVVMHKTYYCSRYVQAKQIDVRSKRSILENSEMAFKIHAE